MVLGMSSGWLIFDIIVLAILVGWGVSAGISAYRRKHYATVLDEDAFREGMRKAQVIDLRQMDAFDKGHILGARSLPYIYLKQQYGELRPDLPVYLYAAEYAGRDFLGQKRLPQALHLKGRLCRMARQDEESQIR